MLSVFEYKPPYKGVYRIPITNQIILIQFKQKQYEK